MYSTVGRPRALTDNEVAEILAWAQSRKSLQQVARDYSVSPSTIHNIIRSNGEYKQASREGRDAARANLRARREAHELRA
jgi:IS30 family transposase